MKLFRKTLLLFAVTILITSFSACTTDDSKDGNLFVSKSSSTYHDGTFAIDIPIDIRDIKGYRRYDNVSRIDLFESYFNFFANTAFERGDVIEFTLYTDNIPYYDFRIVVDRMSKNVGLDYYMNDRHNDYGDFIQELLDEIAANGGAMLRIDGRMSRGYSNLSNFRFGAELNADVDIITWNL